MVDNFFGLMVIFGLVFLIFLALWYEYSAFCLLFILPSGFGPPTLPLYKLRTRPFVILFNFEKYLFAKKCSHYLINARNKQ